MMNGELFSIVIVGKHTHGSYAYNKVLDCSIPWSDRHQSKPQLLTTGSFPSKLPIAQWDSVHNHMVTKINLRDWEVVICHQGILAPHMIFNEMATYRKQVLKTPSCLFDLLPGRHLLKVYIKQFRVSRQATRGTLKPKITHFENDSITSSISKQLRKVPFCNLLQPFHVLGC